MVIPAEGIGRPVALVTALALTLLAGLAWRAGGMVDLWLTPDQRGALAYRAREFSAAADRFMDPAWRARAAYAAGRYEEAAATYAHIPTAVGFFNRGNALMKNREYARAIEAYEQAVARAPDWVEAADNLALARHVRAYLERTREQEDPGEQDDLGADDYTLDETADRGRETEITSESALEAQSAEMWMRSVDTDTRDFLRSRFALEAASRERP